MTPAETFKANRPRIGDPMQCEGKVGIVLSVDREICWVDWATGHDCFIWCFKDGLNTRCDWPTKTSKE